jgi:hypothetical protein
MWHAWERKGRCTRFWWESLTERDHSEDGGVDGSGMDLREIAWGYVEWINLAEVRDRWRAVLNAVMNLRVLAPGSYSAEKAACLSKTCKGLYFLDSV